jgi:hypothetical protein
LNYFIIINKFLKIYYKNHKTRWGGRGNLRFPYKNKKGWGGRGNPRFPYKNKKGWGCRGETLGFHTKIKKDGVVGKP